MKSYYALFLFIFYALPSFSQEDTTQDWLKVLSYGIGNHTDQTEITIKEADERSNQCLPENFTPANLLLSNGSIIENVNVKFDYKENILLVSQDHGVLIGAPNIISRVNFIGSSTYPLLNVNQPGRAFGRRGFYSILLEKDQNYLLRYVSLDLKKKTTNTMLEVAELYDVPEEAPEYIRIEELLISKNQTLYLLDKFNSKSLSQFDELEEPLKVYIKKEKLKFKKDEDLKQFAQYFWSL